MDKSTNIEISKIKDSLTQSISSKGSPKISLTLDEKIKIALFQEKKGGNFIDVKTSANTSENITGGEKINEGNIEKENANEYAEGNLACKIKSKNNIFSLVHSPYTENFNNLKSTKIFKIKKYVKYNKFIPDIFSDEEVSMKDQKDDLEPKTLKISPFSKVNFSKLKPEEKDDRLKNLAKLVKKLRRKLKNLEQKVRFNATKLLNKFMWNKLGINTKNKYLQPEFKLDFDEIVKSIRIAKNHEDYQFDDQKHLIENIIKMVANGTLKLDSLQYKKICSILRTLIPKEKIKFVSKTESKVTLNFPETDVYISKQEYDKIKRYKDNEDLLRVILGVYEPEKEKNAIVVNIQNNKVEPRGTAESPKIADNANTMAFNLIGKTEQNHNFSKVLRSNLFYNDSKDGVNRNQIFVPNNNNLFNQNQEINTHPLNNINNYSQDINQFQNLIFRKLNSYNYNGNDSTKQLQQNFIDTYGNYLSSQFAENLGNFNNVSNLFNNLNCSTNFVNKNNISNFINMNNNQPNFNYMNNPMSMSNNLNITNFNNQPNANNIHSLLGVVNMNTHNNLNNSSNLVNSNFLNNRTKDSRDPKHNNIFIL